MIGPCIKICEPKSTELNRRFGPVVGASLRTAALCVLVGLIWAAPATARGGFHGMGSFGIHGGLGMGRGDLVSAPTYVLIAVSSVTDTDAFKNTMQDLATATAPFLVAWP
jgi:hypothetical protein